MLEPLVGKTKISGKYRVKQPIENFKVRIKIVQQESLLAELFENADETRDGNFLEDEEHTFTWQEKIFGPYEAKYYKDERNCTTEKQREYHRRLEESNEEGSRLYSYIQGDSYYPDYNLLTGKYRSPLSLINEKASPPLKIKKTFSERYNKSVVDHRPSDRRINENHYLFVERETMYIVADLSPKDERNNETTDSEALICTISYDKLRDTLTVTPDFTDDECYTVHGIGMSYNYWIEHVSQKPTLRELQRRREEIKRENHRLRNLKEGQLYHEIERPQGRAIRLILNLDIKVARDFGYDDALFVSYFLELPKNWKIHDGTRLAGRTQRCRAKLRQANFSYCAEIIMDFDRDTMIDGSTCLSWPNVLISVGSIDRWTRYRIEGYGSISIPSEPGIYDLTIQTWRPYGGIIDILRRFFTGGTRELDDITYCAVPAMHEGSSLDKTILRVRPSGVVDLRLNIVQQSQNMAIESSTLERINAGKLLDSVDDVLTRFKAARERMIQARAMCT